MFLYLLDSQESEAFAELMYYAMNKFTDTIDKTVLDSYLNEMNICEYELKGLSLETSADILSGSKKQVRRTVIVELCGLFHSLENYCLEEEQWLCSLAEKLKIEEDAERLIKWSKDFSEFLGIGLMYINAE